MQIRFATRAQHDLKSIWLFIHTENPGAADAVLHSIDQRIMQLRDHPFSGPARSDLGNGVRHLVAGEHLVLYRVTGTEILIVRVAHGSRRLPGRL